LFKLLAFRIRQFTNQKVLNALAASVSESGAFLLKIFSKSLFFHRHIFLEYCSIRAILMAKKS